MATTALRLEQQDQASVYNLSLAPSVALEPVDVNGFYTVTGPQEVTFYATTDKPLEPVAAGWTAEGITGVLGQIQVTGSNIAPGYTSYGSYNWSFTIQTDTDQNIQGTQTATGAILYPPSQFKYKSKKVKVKSKKSQVKRAK